MTGGSDASVEAGTEEAAKGPEAPDGAVEAADEGTDAAPIDAGERDSERERDAETCDVFLGVDYGAAPCR